MKRNKKTDENRFDILNDDLFVEWRLFKTDELNSYWENYIASYPDKADSIQRAIKDFQSVCFNDFGVTENEKVALYRNIINMKRNNLLKTKWIYYSIAASVALLFTIHIVFLKQKENVPMKANNDLIPEIIIGKPLPSTELQLVSGEQIIQFDRNAMIRLSDDGQAIVNSDKADSTVVTLSKQVMNQLIVPSGKRAVIQLSDGTKVWLNSGSRLNFPATFQGNTREINVEGEIYLDVSKDPQHPFYVHTNRFDVLVHGTKFNISVYPDAKKQSVVLVEGKVEISMESGESSVLQPDEILTYDNNNGNITKQKIDVSYHISWIDGILTFNKTPISEVLTYIGRYYNVDFVNSDNARISSKTCSGKLILEDNLDDVMLSLSVLSSVKYYKENDTIYIKDMN
jgi:hypothetical protein